MMSSGTRRRRQLLATTAVVLLVASASLGVSEFATSDGAKASPQVQKDTPVTSNDLRSTRAQNTPVVLADPTDPRFVVIANRLDAPSFSCDLHVSGDGGRGWMSARPVPKIPDGAEKCYGPEVAFDNDGKLYYLFVGLAGAGNSPVGVYLTTSSDRARTFSAPRRILGPGNYQVRMALDPELGERGRLHLVWLQTISPPPLGGLPAPPNPIMAAYSDDGGASFSKPVQVNDAERDLSVAPAIAVGEDHALHVVYYDLGEDVRDYQGLTGPTWEGTWSLVHTRSADAGRSFSKGAVVDGAVVPPERVMLIFTMPPASIAADGSGKVYVSWYDARRGDWDVFLRASSTGGATWGRLRRLNDDRAGRHQYLPRLSVAPGGRLDAIFYDRRGDPKNRFNDVYYTSSTDGGQRFSPNRKLNRHSSDSRVGQRYLVPSAEGFVEFGGRIGLFSARSAALAAWTDTRNAGASRQQDIYATTVAGLPDAASDPNLAVPIALAGLAALAMAGAILSRPKRPAVTEDEHPGGISGPVTETT